MAFLRRWLLIVFALVLGGESIFAATTREDRAYAAGVLAFQDEAWNRAETEFALFVQRFPKSASAPSAVLLQAQAKIKQGKLAEAISLLAAHKSTAGSLADQYEYWTAEAQYQSGAFPGAAETFSSLATKFPASPLSLKAVVEAAAALAQIPDWPQVDELLDNLDGVFQRAAKRDPAGETVVNGRMLQAESKCGQRNFAAAIGILKLMKPAKLKPEQDWQRVHLLYRANLGLGDFEAALATTTNLFQLARHSQGGVAATNLAESVACRADVLEKMGRRDEAIATWQQNLSDATPAGQQQQAVLKLAGLAAQNNLSDEEASLEKYLTQFPAGSPVAQLVLLNPRRIALEGVCCAANGHQPARTRGGAGEAGSTARPVQQRSAGRQGAFGSRLVPLARGTTCRKSDRFPGRREATAAVGRPGGRPVQNGRRAVGAERLFRRAGQLCFSGG